jgi:hypothetical protein
MLYSGKEEQMANTRLRKNQIFAGIFSALFLLMVVTSLFYISSNLQHSCIGEDCPICEEMHITWQTMTSVRIMPVFVAFVIQMLFAALFSIILFSLEECARTLVSLKVELLN